MKNIVAQMKTWDGIEERIQTLLWLRRVFIEPKLGESVGFLRTECGFDDASAEVRGFWITFETQISPRLAADILLHLRSAGALIEHFVDAYRSPEGRTVERALALLNPRKATFPAHVLPVDWRN